MKLGKRTIKSSKLKVQKGFGRKTRKAKKNTNKKSNNNNFVDVRSTDQIAKLETMIVKGPSTYILIYADWCPHCTEYKPTWMNLANMPGRNANMACVHHDMQENIPEIKNAKINGYPSVIKVLPSGEVEEYVEPESGEKTNVIPTNIRDIESRKKEIISAPATKRISAKNIFNKELEEAEELTKKKNIDEDEDESNDELETEIKRKVNSQNGVLNTKEIFETNLRLANQRGGARKAMSLAFSGGGEDGEDGTLWGAITNFAGKITNAVAGEKKESDDEESISSNIKPVSENMKVVSNIPKNIKNVPNDIPGNASNNNSTISVKDEYISIEPEMKIDE